MTLACSLRVNGADQALTVDGAETLLSVLRDRLALLGAKRGCNQGVCGACTVLIDDRPMRSCLSLAANCEGAEITTIEAFEHDQLGRRLQAAFAECGAVQCGFCTAGMLASAHRLLSVNPAPSVEEVQEGLSGNLCRCTGYKKIIDAVRRVAEEGKR
jgi:carbon-monoxide dehydrogenase small subunit